MAEGYGGKGSVFDDVLFRRFGLGPMEEEQNEMKCLVGIDESNSYYNIFPAIMGSSYCSLSLFFYRIYYSGRMLESIA